MSSLEILKKVSLLGSWTEDIFTNDIIASIAARAKTEKGKKVKVRLNETGLKLTRSRFLQPSMSKFFPIKDLKTVTRSPDFAQCALFILADPEKKYKIIALSCSSEADVLQLTNIFAEIQKKQQMTNVELKRRDNGNWTLRERTIHNVNRHVTEIFRSNGQVGVRENGDLTDSAGHRDKEGTSKQSQHKGVYLKRSNQSGSGNKIHKKRTDSGEEEYVESATLPYSLKTDVVTARSETPRPETVDSRPISRPRHTSTTSYQTTSRHPEARRYRTYPGQTIYPKQDVLYMASSRTAMPPTQPVFYRVPPKAYEARMTTSLAGFPTYHRNPSIESELVTVKVGGNRWNVMLDQRSIRSNSSRLSRRSRSYDTYIPTSIVRPIEETYNRPVIIHHRNGNQAVEYRTSSRSYHDDFRYADMQL